MKIRLFKLHHIIILYIFAYVRGWYRVLNLKYDKLFINLYLYEYKLKMKIINLNEKPIKDLIDLINFNSENELYRKQSLKIYGY